MQITMNDRAIECPEPFTILALLAQEGVEPVNIAVAMDDVVVPKRQWESTYIKQGCRILMIRAVQGG